MTPLMKILLFALYLGSNEALDTNTFGDPEGDGCVDIRREMKRKVWRMFA
jgi:hypothetical protein